MTGGIGAGVGAGSLFLLHDAMLRATVRVNSKFLNLIRIGIGIGFIIRVLIGF
jgi:hypothetical protein